MTAVHFRNARLFDPASGVDRPGDLLVDDGRIAALDGAAQPPGAVAVDLEGALLMPGLVDMHVHLRTPGQTEKEDLASGLLAAVRGGFTAVGAMPNTAPVVDRADAARDLEQRAEALGLARLHQYGAVTEGSRGEALAAFGDYARAGVRAATDDGWPVRGADMMRLALLEGAAHGVLVIDHAEEAALAAGGVAHLGPAALDLGLPVQPAEAETVMVVRDIVLAEATGARVHIAHVSTAGSVAAIRAAKAAGVAVTAEATPHHLTLTEAALAPLGTLAKMNPPLRSEADREALVEGLADGTIDAVATDHAPHTAEEKASGWLEAPFGVSGLETALAVLHTDLVLTGRLSLGRLVEALAAAPARILGLAPRALRVGEAANLTVFRPDAAWLVEAESLATRGKNSPYLGRRLTGRAAGVVIEGKWMPT